MDLHPYWFDGASNRRLERLEKTIACDAVVVGGGITGLTIARLLSNRGLDVVLVERDRCGSGATGRSSGFITPDSELQCAQLLRRFGEDDARLLWKSAAAACESIRASILTETIECDYLPAGSLFVGTGYSGLSSVKSEHEARRTLGLPSAFYDAENLPSVFGGAEFEAAVGYEGTFAITPFRYVVALRDRLVQRGVRIFEDSPITSIAQNQVDCERGRVRASTVFLCADSQMGKIGERRNAAYHAQTFLAATNFLPAALFEELFPAGDLLVWDADLIYQYFRRTSDNRLLVGGGLLRNTYRGAVSPSVILKKLSDYVQRHLPSVKDFRFTHAWSGLIGVTKDLLPLAGCDSRGVFYAGCAAGIPWSVLAAHSAVEKAMDGASQLDRFFDPQRVFTDLDPLQPLIAKPVSFAIAHLYTKEALQGSARAVKRRQPVVIALLALAASLLYCAVRWWRSRRG